MRQVLSATGRCRAAVKLIRVSGTDASITLNCLACQMPVLLARLPHTTLAPGSITYNAETVGWVASLHLRYGCSGSLP